MTNATQGVNKMNYLFSTTESEYHNAEEAGNNTHGDYILHNVDVWKYLEIDGKQFCAMWQTGMSYKNGDYHCPNNQLEISEEGGSHSLIVLLDSMYECDFDDDVSEELAQAQEYCRSIKTAEDLFKLYSALCDERPQAVNQFVPSDYDSDDLDDYNEDESTGYLTPK